MDKRSRPADPHRRGVSGAAVLHAEGRRPICAMTATTAIVTATVSTRNASLIGGGPTATATMNGGQTTANGGRTTVNASANANVNVNANATMTVVAMTAAGTMTAVGTTTVSATATGTDRAAHRRGGLILRFDNKRARRRTCRSVVYTRPTFDQGDGERTPTGALVEQRRRYPGVGDGQCRDRSRERNVHGGGVYTVRSVHGLAPRRGVRVVQARGKTVVLVEGHQ